MNRQELKREVERLTSELASAKLLIDVNRGIAHESYTNGWSACAAADMTLIEEVQTTATRAQEIAIAAQEIAKHSREAVIEIQGIARQAVDDRNASRLALDLALSTIGASRGPGSPTTHTEGSPMFTPLTSATVTDAQILMLFETHCTCRPTNVRRSSHSHDCNTGYTDVCCQAIMSGSEREAARAECAAWINTKIRNILCGRLPAHLIDNTFQSDKYPSTPRGKVPLSVKDPTAQDLLWKYAARHETVDPEFSDDLRIALTLAGYVP